MNNIMIAYSQPYNIASSRPCFVIPSRAHGIDKHEHIRTVEQIVSGDKGGMIISPQIGLHEDVLALDYDSEYANLIVNHNLSYETVGGGEAAKKGCFRRS
jgi:DNA polymerase elongation subunit (family B)